MGGMGCLNMAFKYSDYFGTVYSMSAAIQVNNLIQSIPGYTSENVLDYLYEFKSEMDAIVESSADQEVIKSNFLEKKNTIIPVSISYVMSYGLAFAPNTSRSGIYFDFLYKQNTTGYELDHVRHTRHVSTTFKN